MIREMREHRQRPCLKVLNKADLADPAATKAWLDHFNSQKNVRAIAISCKKPGEATKIPKLCLPLAPHRGTVLKPLRMMVMGIPNVGKSTFINALLKKRTAAVGDEPAITKNLQHFELNDHMQLVDTPGMMWPKITYESDGMMLAASNLIGRNAYHESEVAVFLGDLLMTRYPALLKQRYKSTGDGMDGVALIETIAKQRGFRIRGQELDFDKAAMTLLQDYRLGTLGRISLETPATRAEMMKISTPQAAIEQDEDQSGSD
jgi:ribosome biogenesis GTPase A